MDIHSFRFIILLLTLVTLGQMGIDLYLPSFPSISATLHAPASLVQLTITVYLLGFGLAQFFSGPLSDYIGRKKIIIFGFTLFFISSFFCFFAKNIYWLIVFRLFQGLGASVSGMTRIIVRDLYQTQEIYRVSSLMSIFWSLTPIIAPVIGGYIEGKDGRYKSIPICPNVTNVNKRIIKRNEWISIEDAIFMFVMEKNILQHNQNF